jgi:hypothetical protein
VKAFAFDGQGVRYFSSRDNFGELRVLSDLDTTAKLLAPQLFEAFKSHVYGESFFSMLEHRAVSGSQTNSTGSIALFLPAGARVPHNNAECDYSVHLASDRGFLPTLIRFAVNLNANPDVIVETQNEISEVGSGLWVPTRSTRRTFAAAYVGNMNMPASETELSLDMTQSKFNIDIPPEVFEMAYPPGTVVYDNASGSNYVVNQGGEADYKAYATVARKMAQELNTQKLNKKKDGGRSSHHDSPSTGKPIQETKKN